MNISLRLWQEEAYEDFQNNNYKGILKVGTGKGKTVFGIYCIKKFMEDNPDFKTCIVVPTINLMFQWRDELSKFLDINQNDIDLFYGKEKNLSKNIVIFVVNSFVNNISKINSTGESFDFMIADECHHYGANIFSNIFKYKTKYSLGLSATPEREEDPQGTNKIVEGLGKKIFELNHLDDPSSVPPFTIWSILVNLSDDESNTYEDNSIEIIKLQNVMNYDYGLDRNNPNYMKELEKMASGTSAEASKAKTLLGLSGVQASIKYMAKQKIPAIKELVKMERGSKIIIFNERKDFTNKIAGELKIINPVGESYVPGNKVYKVHSGLPKPQVLENLNKFRKAEDGILVTAKLTDEGYDVPDASVAIVASFTGSARQMIQRDGRILRKTDGKESATRYTLVIRGYEEQKYFEILKNTGMEEAALAGQWLQFDENDFKDAPKFKERFINYERNKLESIKKQNDRIIRDLDFFESSFASLNKKEMDPELIQKRIRFLSRIDVKEFLLEDNSNRWPILKSKLAKTKTYSKKDYHTLSIDEKRKLIIQLGKITTETKLPIPEAVKEAIKNYINNDSFEINDKIKRYIVNLTTGSKPPNWPKELFNFIKDNMRKYIDEN